MTLRDELTALTEARNREINAAAEEEAYRLMPMLIEDLRRMAAAGGTSRQLAVQDYVATPSRRLLLLITDRLRAEGLTANLGGVAGDLVVVSWEVTRG